MISNHVEDIITAVKAKPNSLWKNKALSHAHDMLAALKMLEAEEYAHQNPSGHTEPLNAPKPRFCTCPEGGVYTTCPVHGGNKS